jgi:hypothetical protein
LRATITTAPGKRLLSISACMALLILSKRWLDMPTDSGLATGKACDHESPA